MAFAVEEDVAFDPFFVGLFGAVGVVFEADGVGDLVEQFFAFRGGCGVFVDGYGDVF